MHFYSPEKSGFTLIEVLVAIAVAAILMSAINLNLGVRDSLVRISASGQPKAALQKHLNNIINQKTIAELESYVGTVAGNSDLSDPSSTPDRKLVAVTLETAGSGSESINVLAIEVSSGGNNISRWLTPTN